MPSRLRASSSTSNNDPSEPSKDLSPNEIAPSLDPRASPPSFSPRTSQTPDPPLIRPHGPKGQKGTAIQAMLDSAAPPSYGGARAISATSHNDPDYVGVDGDDLVDTDSSVDEGEDD